MSEISIDDYRNIRKRRSPTLMRWWRELNRFGWPAEIDYEEQRDTNGNRRRDAVMTAIAAEIGQREILRAKP